MPSTARAPLLYLVTGGAAALVDIEIFALLSRTRVPIILAAACSFGIATVVNFVLTSRWVFGTTPTTQRYLVFLVGAMLGLLVNVALTYVCMIYLQLTRIPAKTIAIGVTFLLNFLINARVVFRKQLS